MTPEQALAILERDDSTRAERFAAVDTLRALERLTDSERRWLLRVGRLAMDVRMQAPLGWMVMTPFRDLCDVLDEGPGY